MKNHRVSPILLAAAVVLAGGMTSVARAQNATPLGGGRFDIELKDAPLYEAVELIFKANGNMSYIIAEETKTYNIGAVSFPNIAWDDAIRKIASPRNFLLRRDAGGTYHVEPRPRGGAGPAFGVPKTTKPPITLRTNPQTRPTTPAAGEAADVAATGDEEDTGEVVEYYILRVNHIYSGGIAKIFGGQSITTEAFLSPSDGGSGFSGNQGGFTGGQFGGNQFNNGQSNNGQFNNNNGQFNNGQFGNNNGQFNNGQFNNGQNGQFGNNTGGFNQGGFTGGQVGGAIGGMLGGF